jgi:hypothetical protein
VESCGANWSNHLARFKALFFDLAPGAKKKAPAPPDPLRVDQPGLARFFRKCLNQTPKHFHADVDVPVGERVRRIHLEWAAAGATLGMAFWSNSDQTAAVSVMLNGVESPEDMKALDLGIKERGFGMPLLVFETIAESARAPLLIVLSYSRRAQSDVVLSTVVPAFANVFFAQFGTGED